VKDLTVEDKAELERGLKTLRPAFDELAKCFLDPLRDSAQSRAMYGYVKLWELMTAAFQIGAYGIVTDSAKAFFAPEIQRHMIDAQAAKARAANSAQAAERKAKLVEAIMAAASEIGVGKTTLSASMKFALRIRPRVQSQLGLSLDKAGYPSVSTIKNAISAIKRTKVKA
jgi:hypothetical protein